MEEKPPNPRRHLRSLPKEDATPPDAQRTADARGAPFDPSLHTVYTEVSPVSLSPNSDDLVRGHVTKLYGPSKGEDETRLDPDSTFVLPPAAKPIATISWDLVLFGLGLGCGRHPFNLVEDSGNDLLHVYTVLFNKKGNLRTEMEGMGLDLLYIQEIRVEPQYDSVLVGGWLLEHVLNFHSGGCFGAAYYQDNNHLQDNSVFLSRGFVPHRRDKRLLVLDLGKPRPPLTGN